MVSCSLKWSNSGMEATRRLTPAGASSRCPSLPARVRSSGRSARTCVRAESHEGPVLRLGTRASPLALAQAYETRDRLKAQFEELSFVGAVEIVTITTTGDAVQNRPLADIGGKGLFTRELDEALLSGKIDFAVHSLKDVPTRLPPNCLVSCVLPREDVRDALVCAPGLLEAEIEARGGPSSAATGQPSSSPTSDALLATLPPGTKVGTSSLRRAAQVRALDRGLVVVPLRGNVQTRLRRLSEGVCGATLLALAGLRRLGAADVASGMLSEAEMLPAVAQGAIAIARRADDSHAARFIDALDHRASHLAVACERGFLRALDGSCRTPVAGLARVGGAPGAETLRMSGLVAMEDGSAVRRVEGEGAARTYEEADALGFGIGSRLKKEAGSSFFAW